MEAFVQSSEINTIDFILPKEKHVPEIVEQNAAIYRKGATALESALSDVEYLVENRFSVTDIFVGYTVTWGYDDGLLDDYPNLLAYRERLLSRPHCTFTLTETKEG